VTERGHGAATSPVDAEPDPDRRDDGPSPDFPSSDQLIAFLEDLETTGVQRHRLAFTEVDARRTNGHVQGIAAKIEPSDDGRRVTLYASLSDFPPGWGACLIEQATTGAEHGLGMEAMLLPQGRHPGGINICDDLLIVPLEHDARDGRLYLYDVGVDPLYPRLVGAVDSSLTTQSVWPNHDGGDSEKASAAGLARMTRSWAAPTRRLSGDGASDHSSGPDPVDDRYLVVVLSESRYLRFIELARDDSGRFGPTDWTATADMRDDEHWSGGFVDNISLVNLRDGGWGLVAFSAENLWRITHLQRSSTIDRVSCYRLTFPERRERGTARGPGDPKLEWLRSADVRRPDKAKGDMFWPGFRWGASVTWTGEAFALFMAEWFGNEEAKSEVDEATGHVVPGGVMYVQFDTNLDVDPFGFEPIPADPSTDLEREPVAAGPPPAIAAVTSTGDTAGSGNSTGSGGIESPAAAARTRLPHFGAGHAAGATQPPRRRRWFRIVRDIPPVAKLALIEGGRVVWGLTLLLAAAGVLALAIALPGLTWSLFLAGAGSILGVVGVGLVAIGLEDSLRNEPARRTWFEIGTGVGAVGGAVGTILAFVAERPVMTAVLSAVAIVSAGIWNQLVVRPSLDRWVGDRFGPGRHGARPTAAPGNRSWLLAVVMAVSIVLVTVATRAEPERVRSVVWVGLAVALLLLLTAIKFLAWPVFRAVAPGRFSWLAALRAGLWWWSALTAGTAVVLVALALDGRTVAAGLLAAWVVTVVASIWGAVEYQRPQPGDRYLSWVFSSGVAAAVIAAASTFEAVPDVLVTAFVVSAAITVGLFVVWPGEASVLLVALALVLAWGAADLDDGRQPDRELVATADAPTRWVVALGDSFISGEGASSFYTGTNHPGVNVCRRAPTAWPDLAAAHLATLEAAKPDGQRHQVRLASFACSGATITDIVDRPQHREATGTIAGNRSQLDELDIWLASLDPDDEVAYVLVSAGGNDAGFAEVIAACLTPAADCDGIVDDFRYRTAPVELDLERLLDGLEARWPDAPIAGEPDDRPTVIVNPYLDPFGAADGPRCGGIRGQASLIAADEVAAIRVFRHELNTRIRSAIGNYRDGAEQRLPVELNSRGAGVDGNLCRGSDGDRPTGQNWLVLQPTDRVGEGSLAPFMALVPSSAWFLGSVHPNAVGHRDIGDTVCSVITRAEQPSSFAPGCDGSEVVAANQAPASQELPICSLDAADGMPCEDTAEVTERWVESRQRAAATRLGGAVGIGILGGVLLGSASAHHPRIRRRRPPKPPAEVGSSDGQARTSIDLRA